MAWLRGVLMAPLRMLAAGIIKACRQLDPSFNGLEGQIPKTGSPAFNYPQVWQH